MNKRFICIIMAVLILTAAPLTSYREARAADIVLRLGEVAVKDILMDILIAAGITTIGGITIHEVSQNESLRESLIDALLSSPCLDAINDIERYREENQQMFVSDVGYTSLAGYDLGFSGGKLRIVVNPMLIAHARNAIKAWADSSENIFDLVEGEDQAGTQEVDSPYMKSIETTVKTIPAIDSMSDMDSAFGISGACSYLKSQGYSDDSYYWLVWINGAITYFTPVPFGYSVVGYRTAYMGSNGRCIMSNADYKNAIVQNGIRDASSFYSYFFSLSIYKACYYGYNLSTSEWDKHDGLMLPRYDVSSCQFDVRNLYTVGYKKAYADGSLITGNSFSNPLVRTLYTFDTVGNFFKYDLSKAPSIPDSGVSFSIPESDYPGFGERALSELVSYITSLSEELKDSLGKQEENQEEIIQQGKDTLEAINNMHTTIGKISAFVGHIFSVLEKILSAVYIIVDAVITLSDDIADALSAMVLPGQNELIDAFVALPGAMVLELAEVLPGIITDAIAVAVSGIVIPEIVIPEIVVPEIVIPEISVPEIVVPDLAVPDVNVELNPAYNITVENDFTGLGDIIASAVQGVLEKCFVPDEAATMEKFGEMGKYFKFKDDIIAAVGDLKVMIFGVNPSPILKIPIGKVTSKKYDYGTGSYIIIDVSWYSQYKQFGDKIILAIAWAFFIWRMFIKLPGIISGTEASIVAADKSYHKYNNSEKG